MALTFVRTSELIGAQWSEFDLNKGEWRIPAERMKMPSPHIVPLSQQAVAVLREVHTITGHGEFVFPHDSNPRKSMSNNTMLHALYRMGYGGAHDGAWLPSTVLHENGFDHAHIELQLAHMERNTVSAAYNHATYLKQRAGMMQW